MKKVLLLALTASLLILPCCNKKSGNNPTTPTPDPVVKNKIIESFDYSIPLYHADSTKVVDQLDKDGWTLSQTTENYLSYTLLDEDSISHIMYVYFDKAVANKIMVMLTQMDGGAQLTSGVTVKEFMSHIGDTYKLGDQTWPFLMLAYKEGGKNVQINDYNDALNQVIDICAKGDIGIAWASKSYEGIFLNKQYSSNVKQDVIIYMIGAMQ